MALGAGERANRGFEVFRLKRRDLEEFICFMYFHRLCARGGRGSVNFCLELSIGIFLTV